MYKISEFADMTGLTKETLRYYEKVGLLEPAFTDPENRYRYYDDGSCFLAVLLVELRSLGFTIQEMRSAMNDESFARLEQLVIAKREKIQQQIHELQSQTATIDIFLLSGQGEEQ